MNGFDLHFRIGLLTLYIVGAVGCESKFSSEVSNADSPGSSGIESSDEADSNNEELSQNDTIELKVVALTQEISTVSQQMQGDSLNESELAALEAALQALMLELGELRNELETISDDQVRERLETLVVGSTMTTEALQTQVKAMQGSSSADAADGGNGDDGKPVESPNPMPPPPPTPPVLDASLTLTLVDDLSSTPIDTANTVFVNVTVTNTGEGEARNIELPSMASPWSFVASSCSDRLASEASCSITVKVLSPGVQDLSTSLAVDYKINVDASDVSTVSLDIVAQGQAGTLAVVPAFPTEGANWMEYIDRQGTADPFEAVELACSNAWDDLDKCFHAGELRLMTLPEGAPGCSGLTIVEDLGLLNWRCEDSSGITYIQSTGLRDGIGLADFLTPTGWKDNFVEISQDGILIYKSDPAAWWSNPIVELPENPVGATVELTASGTIYILTTSKDSEGYKITAPEVGLVAMPGATLKYAGSGTLNCGTSSSCDSSTSHACLISSVYGYYGWIEGTFDAKPTAGTTADVAVMGCYYSTGRMHNVTGTNANLYGIRLEGAYNAFLSDVKAANNVSYGFYFHYIEQVRVDGLLAANNGSHGIRVYDSYVNRYNDIRSYNNAGHGISTDFSNDDFFTNVVAAFNAQDGINFDDVWSDDRAWHSITAFGNGGNGIVLDDAGQCVLSQVVTAGNTLNGLSITGYGDDLMIADLVSTNNGAYGVETAFGNAADPVHFSGKLIVGSNATADCLHAQGTGFASDCASGATLHTGADLALSSSAFVGKVTSDSSNALGGTGTATDAANVSDWLAFDNDHRVWGPESGDLFSAKGSCTASTCRIWDLSLMATSSIFDRSHTYTAANDAFTSGAACPASVHGDVVTSNFDGTLTYLSNAIELTDHIIGNNNGVCESNEYCVYLPNFGSYRGFGALSESCVFTDGVVSNVTIYSQQ